MAAADHLLHIDATIAEQGSPSCPLTATTHDCCLVQIYPTNICDGLVRIDRNNLSIGREPSNDLVLSDGSVSRHHAKLERRLDTYLLRDLDSTNGTFVDEQQITDCALRGGETVRFGSFIFKFLVADGIEAQYHATVYDAMTRDGLTRAFNKSFLMDSLQQEIARSLRCNRPLSVLLMDIDYFKKINDTHGHLVGDDVLREFCYRISSAKREDDLLCRYGGEEFALVLAETGTAEAFEVAEKCRLAVSEAPLNTSGGPIPVTVSIGVAQLAPASSGQASALELLKLADEQLYRAKNSGRNRVRAAGDSDQV